MIVPHYDAILHALGTSRKDIQNEMDIQIPVTFLKFLLKNVIKNEILNEAGYLAENPDVAAAVKAKRISSGREHYLTTGFFEGRRGALPDVDETWYQKANPDVALAIRKGELRSAKEHFNMIGAEEFRAPSQEYVSDCLTWKVALENGTDADGCG
ncbi:MAG: hypothetical protein L0Z53_15540 [Acidobacteriales bacterium]|nr:hypothetical protein [Terriglobales bacterium]